MPALHSWLETEFQLVHEPATNVAPEDEEPIVRPRRARPFELPGLGVPKEVDFGQAFCEGVLECERRQGLEGRTPGKLRVVAGLQEHEPASIARAVRRCDSTAVDREKQESKPASIRRAAGELGVEAMCRRIAADRRPIGLFPAGRLETERLVTGVTDCRAVFEHFQPRMSEHRGARPAIAKVLPEL